MLGHFTKCLPPFWMSSSIVQHHWLPKKLWRKYVWLCAMYCTCQGLWRIRSLDLLANLNPQTPRSLFFKYNLVMLVTINLIVMSMHTNAFPTFCGLMWEAIIKYWMSAVSSAGKTNYMFGVITCIILSSLCSYPGKWILTPPGQGVIITVDHSSYTAKKTQLLLPGITSLASESRSST